MEIKKSFDASVVSVRDVDNNNICVTLHRLDTSERKQILWWFINDFVVVPQEVLADDGTPKVGATLHLWEMADGRIFPNKDVYPARTYPIREKKHTSLIGGMCHESLYENTIFYESCTLDELTARFYKRMKEFDEAVIAETFAVLHGEGDDTKYKYLTQLLGVECNFLPSQESETMEYKSSFIHCAYKAKNERIVQYNNLFSEIAAFANSHIEADILVGVADNGTIVGIENELLNETTFKNRSNFEADFRNQLTQSLDNFAFCKTISMTWFRTEDRKVFCRIHIPKWSGKTILLNGSELYVRDGSASRWLKNDDLINYIIENHTAMA